MVYPVDQARVYQIKICDHVLDNLYGQIGLTEVERSLERLPIFKRLHNISQLGVVNWIFPCALHTRYVHSLGVMHVASEMATHINANMGENFFNDNDIQVLRLAGMLHDIGHYPLSHNIEMAYKESHLTDKYNEEKISANLKHYINCPDYLAPNYDDSPKTPDAEKDEKLKAEEKYANGFNGSEGFHHEYMGYQIIIHNQEIRARIKNNFVLLSQKDGVYLNPYFTPHNADGSPRTQVDETEVDKIVEELLCAIAEIVRGNYGNENAVQYPWQEKFSAMVQLIHSEMDADNIDYLLRDATFSGTSYGIMDMGVLLNCLIVKKFEDKVNHDPKTLNYRYIVGIQKKGIGSVEQFLLNKFMAYSQMILSKYVSILEAMLLRLESDHIIVQDDTYSCEQLSKMVEDKKDNLQYLAFSDYHILQSIFNLAKASSTMSRLPKAIVTHLSSYSALELDRTTGNECLCTSLSKKEIREVFEANPIYQAFIQLCDSIGDATGLSIDENAKADLFSFRFESYSLTKQEPIEQFLNRFIFDGMCTDRRFNFHYYRLGEGIPILDMNRDYVYAEKDNTVIREGLPDLCVDSPLSSLHDLYKMQFVTLRKYDVQPYSACG